MHALEKEMNYEVSVLDFFLQQKHILIKIKILKHFYWGKICIMDNFFIFPNYLQRILL